MVLLLKPKEKVCYEAASPTMIVITDFSKIDFMKKQQLALQNL